VKLISSLILRDLRAALSGGAWLPVAFFLLVAILFPFGVGPDGALLTRTGGGVLWVAALLAALLPVDRLIAPDAENGVLDQLAVRGVSEELIVSAKFLAHWMSFGPLLMLAAIPAAGLLRLEGVTLAKLEIGLLIGTPGLAALGILASCLTLGLRRAGSLAGLLMLPLAVPLLIFGAGSLAPMPGSALALLGAASLFLCAITPFAGGAALRAGRE
jgi:heme exporter protein B